MLDPHPLHNSKAHLGHTYVPNTCRSELQNHNVHGSQIACDISNPSTRNLQNINLCRPSDSVRKHESNLFSQYWKPIFFTQPSVFWFAPKFQRFGFSKCYGAAYFELDNSIVMNLMIVFFLRIIYFFK